MRLPTIALLALFLGALIVAGHPARAAGCDVEVADWPELQASTGSPQTVCLTSDIAADRQGQLAIPNDISLVLDLAGHNLTIKHPGDELAAINVPSRAGLSIEDSAGGGLLTATGDDNAAGIGGNDGQSAGTIMIAADVSAKGGSSGALGGAAAIGGGRAGTGGEITIQSGEVTATAGPSGSGIGGGQHAGAGTVTITGGTVTAFGGSTGGAGIGGGDEGGGGIVRISGGSVITTSGSFAAGIGGGLSGAGGVVEISGGTVLATSKTYGAGIGGGFDSSGGQVSVSGGKVTAIGGTGGGPSIGTGALRVDSPAPDPGTLLVIGTGDVLAPGGATDAAAPAGYDPGLVAVASNQPAAPGFLMTTTDATNSSEQAETIIDFTFPPSLLTEQLPPGDQGRPYLATIDASGSPAPVLSVDGLPADLVFDPATGTISGTPLAAGEFPISIQATNGISPPASVTLQLVISAAPTPPSSPPPSPPATPNPPVTPSNPQPSASPNDPSIPTIRLPKTGR